ncbi:50S ribosomal protein L25/general stress protein Ctc [Gordonia sp. HY002]|uniref:50S ribosomal protein L25/general stress protein Ctc n=1 Tax=Gordonia zhenghanii TaxID=2911516 RepID=UPI001EEFA7B4|nr:50S ribosomal protein L25/general stress protein Ctc [Gordonia zhenghanii]MCF8570327.1 50S ribosomal protein L25/general stress protein Ctc [Gordonia zhenghanii]MCF8605943.1 50S ribosomal protein L25/general stress protein Ctc [Gordonia zhenghanii]
MSNKTPTLSVTIRTGRGKGAARRARNEGLVPAVVYGHGTDPQHLLLPKLELNTILRNYGLNAVIDLDIEGTSQLVLARQVDVHPLRDYVEHIDFLVIRRGEKVVVDIPVLVEGTPMGGTLTVQEASSVEVEAEAMHIPESIIVDVENAEAGTLVTAGDLNIPSGVTLVTNPEYAIVAVNEAKSAAATEDEIEGDAEGDATEAADE